MMNKLEKLVFIFAIYLQALWINAFMASMLSGINLIIFVAWAIWSFVCAPILILIVEMKKYEG